MTWKNTKKTTENEELWESLVQLQIQLLKSCEDCGYLILNVDFLLDVDQ